MDLAQFPQVGEILEQGKQTTVNTVKSGISDTISSVQGQVGIKNVQGVAGQTHSQNQLGQTGESSTTGVDQNLDNELTEQMVKDFYAPSDPTVTPKPQSQEELETQQKLVKLRQELHAQVYFDPLFAYEHKTEESQADMVEKQEEQQKMMDLEQKKEDKKLPLAVQRAQTSVEVNRGSVG